MVSKRQFSKKDGIVLISSLVVLLLISVCAFIDDYVKRTEYIPAYSTPEKAIEETLQTTDYVLTVQDDTAFAVCNTPVNNYACQYIMLEEDGWRVVTKRMFDNAYFSADGDKNEYFLYIRKYSDKYTFTVIQYESSIRGDNDILTITESSGTKIDELKYDVFLTNKEDFYWYWYLDEIPKGYTVEINGETVYANRWKTVK